ncbi:MAG: hypothetical protein ACYDCN_00250 [Bacteroidia bacterium]
MAAAKKRSLEFPSSDKKFDPAFKGLMTHLGVADPDSGSSTVTWSRLGMDAATIYNPLVGFLGTATTPNTWLRVFPLQENHTTRTPTTKTQKNTLKKEILSIVRSERKILKEKEHTTPGFLTANDKQFWYIPETNVRTNTAETLRTAHPVPVISIFETKHLQHVLEMHDAANPTSHALPDGIVLIEYFRYIGTVPPTDPSQFKHLLFSTHFRDLSKFAVGDVKQEAWYCARFIGSQGQEGDYSLWVSAVIG